MRCGVRWWRSTSGTALGRCFASVVKCLTARTDSSQTTMTTNLELFRILRPVGSSAFQDVSVLQNYVEHKCYGTKPPVPEEVPPVIKTFVKNFNSRLQHRWQKWKRYVLIDSPSFYLLLDSPIMHSLSVSHSYA